MPWPAREFVLSSSCCLDYTIRSFNTSLLLLWRFEGNAVDDTGQVVGTLMGNPSFITTGYIRYALHLNSSTRGNVRASFLDFIFNSFTIELWIRIESLPETDYMVLISQNDLLLLLRSDGRLTINATSPGSGKQLNANTWYHLALAFDRSIEQQKIYINGLLDSTWTQGFYSNATNPFLVGTMNFMSNYFFGDVDHFSITKRLKSAYEILRDASLLGSYPFTGDFGNAQLDTGPCGFTGTLSASVHQVSTGAVGDALSFNGSSDYFQVLLNYKNHRKAILFRLLQISFSEKLECRMTAATSLLRFTLCFATIDLLYV